MDNAFLSWLDDWNKKLPVTSLQSLQSDPKKIAIVCVDMVVGFCSKGPLSSPYIADIIPNVVNCMKTAEKYGVKNFTLVQDAHDHKAEEFNAFPPHCQKGSEEAETVPEIAKLSFANLFTLIQKNSLSPAYDTKFDEWVAKNPEINTFIVIGDCTDLCIYSMAMHLRLSANSKNKKIKVVVPADCVETYDIPVKAAKKLGAFPHDRELLHKIFLYHMALNGVEVVKNIK